MTSLLIPLLLTLWSTIPWTHPSLTSASLSSSSSSSFICPLPSGNFAFPDDVSKFYMCERGQSFLMSCPRGKVFRNRVCVDPSLVDDEEERAFVVMETKMGRGYNNNNDDEVSPPPPPPSTIIIPTTTTTTTTTKEPTSNGLSADFAEATLLDKVLDGQRLDAGIHEGSAPTQTASKSAPMKFSGGGGGGGDEGSIDGSLVVSLVPRVAGYYGGVSSGGSGAYFGRRTLTGRLAAVTDFSMAYTGDRFARLSAGRVGGVKGGVSGGGAETSGEYQVGVYTRYPCETHGEFSADFERCSIFYKCDNFRYVKFRCPGNLKWNQGRRMCDWTCDKGDVAFVTDASAPRGSMKTTENLVYAPPTTTTPTTTTPKTTPGVDATLSRVTGSTELSGQVCFKSGAYLPDLGDCSVVYQCVSGQLIKLFCRNGLFWNHLKQVCDAKCERRGYFTLEPLVSQTTNTRGRSEAMTTTTTTTTPAPTKTTTTTPPDSDDGYRTEIGCSDVFDYIKDQVSDRIFYRCIHGALFRFSCQRGTVWNQNLKVCQMRTATTSSTEDKTAKTTTTSSSSSSSSPSSSVRRSPFSSVDDHGFVINDVPCEADNAYVPDPHDCSVVYLCIKNSVLDRKIKFSCPPGKYWNNARTQCDWTCDRGTTTTTTTTTEKRTSSGRETTTTTKTTTKPLAFDCPPGSEAYFPHLTDCSKFFHCHDGVPREKACPAGLSWNQNKRECDWTCEQGAYAVRGAMRSVTAPQTTPWRTTAASKAPVVAGKAPLTSRKVNETSVFCSTEGVHLPDPLDCSVFYLCANNRLFRFRCGWGYWNHSKKACDRACDDAGYADDAGVPAERLVELSLSFVDPDEAVSYLANSEAVGGAFGKMVNGVEGYGGGGGGGVTGRPTSRQPRPRPRSGRPCGSPNKFYSEPLDCSVFYVCTHGNLVEFSCPGGSMWNQRKGVCDWVCDNFE